MPRTVPRTAATAAASEPFPSTEQIRLVLADTDQSRARALALALMKARHAAVQIISVDDEPRGELNTADVVILYLDDKNAALAAAVLARLVAPAGPELVLMVDDPLCPEAQAAEGLGLDRVLAREVAVPWLSEALEPLASIARARRALRAARERLPSLPRVTPLPKGTLPLFVAEARFRETYLRALVSISGSRQQAAALSRVPYRTLCRLVRRHVGRPRSP